MPPLTPLPVNPETFIAICVVLGLIVGSFLNVVIHRLPKMLERQWRSECAALSEESGAIAATPEAPYNLAVPHSSCPACGHRITALENIPLISYAWLRGKCSACKAPIPLRYPAVEVLAGILAGYVAWRYGITAQTAGALIFTWACIALAFIDLDTQYLPDNITLPLLWAGLLFNLDGTFATLPAAVIGAVAGYGILWAVFWAFKLTTGKEGMGYGDFKLLAAIGAWLGWKMLPLVILLSSFVGAAVGVAMIVFVKHRRETPIPFGPYLAAAGLIALFWGEPMMRYYLARV
ncbi:MAG TPA: A24 family peptidase [Burkholderiales bacterium]|nr:A24 family peptidase [Burkholderiales bacterium]